MPARSTWRIGSGVLISQNVTGQAAFGYTLDAEEVRRDRDGVYAHYIPGSGTSITSRSAIPRHGRGHLIDSFTFDNAMEMTDVLRTAMEDNDMRRISALLSASTTWRST